MKSVSDILWGVQQIVVVVGHVPVEGRVGEIDRRVATYEMAGCPDHSQIIRHRT
jgi:hypothetical protein